MTTIRVQTPYLRMAGLGVAAAPADPSDPHDLEGPGIHLRWGFPTRWPGGVTIPLGWPEAGFTLYRREAEGGAERALDLPSTAANLGDDATLPVAGGARFEFDPDLLAATLAHAPQARGDLDLLLDAYPGYVTLRFQRAVRQVTLGTDLQPLPRRDERIAVVRAHDGDDCVDEDSVVGSLGGDHLAVSADYITHLRIRLDGRRLTTVSYLEAPTTAELDDWTLIAALPPATDWETVRDRIPASFQAAYEPGWTDLGGELARLFDPADDRPRWDREFTDTGLPPDGDPATGEAAPTWSYNLQSQLALFTVDPFVARLLGLLYADTSAEAAGGGAFDYLVVATFQVPEPPSDASGRGRAPALGADPADTGPFDTDPFDTGSWLPGGGPVFEPTPPDGTGGWITFGLSTASHQPLAPPAPTVAEATPPQHFLPDPATGTLTERARIGVAWTLRPEGDGGPIDAGAVRYDVEVMPHGAHGWTLLTLDAPVVVTATVDELGNPAEPDHFLIDRRGAGTHAYRVLGIDVFGRRSRPSDPIEVTVFDTVGPPAPVNIWVKYLDTGDPFLAADEQPLGEGLLVRFDYPRRPSEAGSDATSFEVLTVNGTRDRTLDWHDPATWPALVTSVPRQAPASGTASTVVELTEPGTDPATRYFTVTTDLAGGTGGGTDTSGNAWALRPGYLMVSDQEYPVAGVEHGPRAAFTLTWPDALGLPDPAPGPCTWYPGYQVFVPGYPLPLDGAASVTGAAAAGATDVRGNRGRVSAAAAFQRVDRTAPAAPGAFTLGTGELLASEPDGYGKSRFTLTWEPLPAGARQLVYRALDAAVLACHGLTVADGRALDAAALQALAADPVAGPAFSRLTAGPVSEASYTDETIEGFGSNRYLYRLGTVSLAGVPGPLGDPSPPVAVPDVVPPRQPRIVRALGGDQVVTLTIAPNREHDVAGYRVYRATGPAAAADIRRMTMVGTVAHDPTAASFPFTDAGATTMPPEPRADLRYRVTAVDQAGNESRPSRMVAARCFSTAAPAVPVLSVQRGADGANADVTWPAPEPGVTVLVQRQDGERDPADEIAWQAVSGWLAAPATEVSDQGLDPAAAYRYRLKAMSPTRVVATSDPVEAPAP